MRFALNYSQPTADLLREGKIEVDILKCPDWPHLIEEARALRPVYVHFKFQAGQGDATAEALEQAAAYRDETNTPYINTHFAPRPADVSHTQDASAYIERAAQDIHAMIARFGAEHVIVENIPYPEQINTKPALVIEPENITRLVEDSGCGFLLDIGHARRASEYLAVDPRRYIEALPVHCLREVHVTGLGYNAKGRRTDHLPMREDDWEIFAWVLEHIHSGKWPAPWAIACEYGGFGEVFAWRTERSVIAEQIPRMAEMIRQAQPA